MTSSKQVLSLSILFLLCTMWLLSFCFGQGVRVCYATIEEEEEEGEEEEAAGKGSRRLW